MAVGEKSKTLSEYSKHFHKWSLEPAKRAYAARRAGDLPSRVPGGRRATAQNTQNTKLRTHGGEHHTPPRNSSPPPAAPPATPQPTDVCMSLSLRFDLRAAVNDEPVLAAPPRKTCNHHLRLRATRARNSRAVAAHARDWPHIRELSKTWADPIVPQTSQM